MANFLLSMLLLMRAIFGTSIEGAQKSNHLQSNDQNWTHNQEGTYLRTRKIVSTDPLYEFSLEHAPLRVFLQDPSTPIDVNMPNKPVEFLLDQQNSRKDTSNSEMLAKPAMPFDLGTFSALPTALPDQAAEKISASPTIASSPITASASLPDDPSSSAVAVPPSSPNISPPIVPALQEISSLPDPLSHSSMQAEPLQSSSPTTPVLSNSAALNSVDTVVTNHNTFSAIAPDQSGTAVMHKITVALPVSNLPTLPSLASISATPAAPAALSLSNLPSLASRPATPAAPAASSLSDPLSPLSRPGLSTGWSVII